MDQALSLHPQSGTGLQANDDVPALPLEYSRLKRPKVSSSISFAASGFNFVFSLVWIIFFVIFLSIGAGITIKAYQEYGRLSQDGLTTSATITKLVEDRDSEGSTFYVYYQFSVSMNGDPVNFEDRDSVSRNFYTTHEVGQTIEILYAASDPNLNAIRTELNPPHALIPIILIGGGIVFLSIGLRTLYNEAQSLRHWSQLRSNGRQAQAVIFDRWQGKDSDGDPTYLVAFAFEIPSPDAEQKIITYAEKNRTIYRKYQIGEMLPICYLPDNPSICQVGVM